MVALIVSTSIGRLLRSEYKNPQNNVIRVEM
jgi:hypothetical protein